MTQHIGQFSREGFLRRALAIACVAGALALPVAASAEVTPAAAASAPRSAVPAAQQRRSRTQGNTVARSTHRAAAPGRQRASLRAGIPTSAVRAVNPARRTEASRPKPAMRGAVHPINPALRAQPASPKPMMRRARATSKRA